MYVFRNTCALISVRAHVFLSLPSYDDIHIKVLVSLPPSYPTSSPPQLQLLSRYIGAFSVDRDLFGSVIKTFISLKSGVEYSPDTVVVFDGLQHVIEMCSVWYNERLSAEKLGELVREEEKSHANSSNGLADQREEHTSRMIIQERQPVPSEMPAGLELIEAEPITDRKSVFIGRACRITHPSQVRA
jgi:hypothetical protein